MGVTLAHRLTVADPASHLFEVETVIRSEDGLPAPLTVFMPVWTPGSYLIREFARHVEGLSAEVLGLPVAATKVRKNAWRVDGGGATTCIRYRVYAHELSVRTCHVDESHAFINGAGAFLAVEGAEKAPCTVEIVAPEGWRVSTSLPAVRESVYAAESLDALVDAPFEIGTHHEESFDVLGKTHRFAIWPQKLLPPDAAARVAEDTRAILVAEAGLFGGGLPYDAYLFVLHLSARGRGGLEHASAATLLASPSAFASRDAYLDLLSLIAHEAFHAWNVKRIRPQGLTPYRYEEENYTRQLWWFEGATSYYDWRILRRARLCSIAEYLDHLAGEMSYLEGQPGRLVHSLEDASFDAWIKAYRPDENTPNSTVSYYRKGEVVCAMLDLEIRARTGWRVGLDAVLAHIWEHFGVTGVPVPEGALQGIFERVSDVPLGDLFDAWVRAPGEVDCEGPLGKVGLKIERGTRGDATASLGARLRGDLGRTIVSQVFRGGAAQLAGIDPGDEIVAIDGARTESGSAEDALHDRRPGQKVNVLVSREGQTSSLEMTLDPPRQDRLCIVTRTDATDQEKDRFVTWLGDAYPAWRRP